MMTRKDYVATAEILNSYGSDMKLEVFEDLVNDFTEMFAYQGMQVKEVFGDYSMGEYDLKKSKRLIIIAEKKQ